MIGGYLLVRIVPYTIACMKINLVAAELQMRRPGLPKYRLDNLLERKAKEGVKVYVIV